jgi:hypothetical protein
LICATAAERLCRAAGAKDPVQVLPVPDNGIQPQIAVAGNALRLIYFAGDPKHGDILYRRSDDFGHSFSLAMRANSQEKSAIAVGAIRGAQISIGKANRVHVAWNGSDTAEPKRPVKPEVGNSPMLYARLDDKGAAFEPQRNLMQSTFGLNGGGSVASDRSGNVYVAWHGAALGTSANEAGRQVWIARSRDDGRTFAKESSATAEPTGVCGCCGMKLFADSRGEVYALYRSARRDVHRDIYLLHSTDAAGTFSAALLHPWNINACPMSSMTFVETGALVFGAWETQTQVYFAPVSRGANRARSAIVAPPGQNPKRKYPALARNRRGETLLAWVEGSAWQRGGALGWQIFDPSGRPSAACSTPRDVPVWSFPAVFARPDDGFTIIV